jgi:uncharacterized membrane protein YphA (DoxX/SURF4 family)
MSLKSAAFFSLIGMVLLTVLLAVGFIRDVSALLAGAIAAVAFDITDSFAGKPESGGIPVRVPQRAGLRPQQHRPI